MRTPASIRSPISKEETQVFQSVLNKDATIPRISSSFQSKARTGGAVPSGPPDQKGHRFFKSENSTEIDHFDDISCKSGPIHGI